MGVNAWGEQDVPNDAFFHGFGCKFTDDLNETSTHTLNLPQRLVETNNLNSVGSSGYYSNEEQAMSMETETPIMRTHNQHLNENNETFPCLDPCNLRMRNVTERKESFRDLSWTMNHTSDDTNKVAEAGFFYLGTFRLQDNFCSFLIKLYFRNRGQSQVLLLQRWITTLG